MLIFTRTMRFKQTNEVGPGYQGPHASAVELVRLSTRSRCKHLLETSCWGIRATLCTAVPYCSSPCPPETKAREGGLLAVKGLAVQVSSLVLVGLSARLGST